MTDRANRDDREGESVKAGVLVPQRHGGALQRGRSPVDAHLSAVPAKIRRDLRTDFAERRDFLKSVVDGGLVQRIRFRVMDLAPHVECEACGEPGTIALAPRIPARNPTTIDIEVDASASPKDRLSALDMMGKYGLGTVTEVSAETVRGKVAETVTLLRSELEPAMLARVLAAMRSIWA